MSNLIKNKLLITMLFVVSLFVMYDVGWSAVTPVTLTSITRTANVETQESGITKILHTTTVRYDFDTLTAAGWYGDTTTYDPLIIPATSLSGVKAWSASAWISALGSTGQFSDSIGTSTGDTCEVIWEYSMDGNRWYTTEKVATGHPQESRMLTASATTNAGTNFIAFGPIDRFGDRTAIMDSTSALKTIDASILPAAQYIRGRVYIHGIYNPVGIAAGSKYGTVVYKGVLTLKKE